MPGFKIIFTIFFKNNSISQSASTLMITSPRSNRQAQRPASKIEGFKSVKLDSLNELLNSCKSPKVSCIVDKKGSIWTRSNTLSSLETSAKHQSSLKLDDFSYNMLKVRKHPISLSTIKEKGSDVNFRIRSSRNFEPKEPMSARSAKNTCFEDELFTNDIVGFLNVNPKSQLFQRMTDHLDGKEPTSHIKAKPQITLNQKILHRMGSLKPITESEPKKEKAGTMVFTDLWAPKKKKVLRGIFKNQTEKAKELDLSYPSINDTSLDQNKTKKTMQDSGSQPSTKSELSLPSLSIINRKKSHSEAKNPLTALKSFTERNHYKGEN